MKAKNIKSVIWFLILVLISQPLMVLAGELSALNNVSEDFLERDVEVKFLEINNQTSVFNKFSELSLDIHQNYLFCSVGQWSSNPNVNVEDSSVSKYKKSKPYLEGMLGGFLVGALVNIYIFMRVNTNLTGIGALLCPVLGTVLGLGVVEILF